MLSNPEICIDGFSTLVSNLNSFVKPFVLAVVPFSIVKLLEIVL